MMMLAKMMTMGWLGWASATLIAVVGLYVILSILFRPPVSKGDRLPVVSGRIPWLGAALEFYKGGAPFLLSMARKHPEGYNLHMAGKIYTLLTNPDDISKFYKAPYKEVSFFDGLRVLGLGDVVGLGMSGPEHNNLGMKTLRARVVPTFTKTVPQVLRELNAVFSELGQTGTIPSLNNWARVLVLRLSASVLAGETFARGPWMTDMCLYDDMLVKSCFAGGAERARLVKVTQQYRRKVADHVLVEIKRRHDTNDQQQDLLRYLLEAEDANGKHLTEDVVALEMCGYFFATVANTFAAVTVMLLRILQTPTLRSDMLAEAEAAGWSCDLHDEVSFQTLQSLQLTHAVFKEVMRVHSAPLHVRLSRAPLELKSGSIPANRLLAVSPYVVHHNEATFKDPMKYDPARWLRGEGTGPNDYLPWGRGLHRCAGSNLAEIEVKVTVLCFLKAFDYRLGGTKPLDSFLEITKQNWHTGGLPAPPHSEIVFKRRTASA